jgi:acyl-CoA ligase (AMP-forming) (exosortase A-associated)
MTRMSKTNIADLLKESAERWPDKTAVVKGSTALSYREIVSQRERLSACLINSGACQGDRIGIFLAKSADEALSIFALASLRAIFIVLNSNLKEDQIAHIVSDCGIKGIITSVVLSSILLNNKNISKILDFLVIAEDGVYNTKRLQNKNRTRAENPAGKEVACIIYTSGSTGKPKGIVITHKNLFDGAEIVSEYLDCIHDDRVLSLLPFSFDYGLNQLMTTFLTGGTIVLHNFIFPDDVLMVIEKEKITALAGIPTIWISLLNSPSINRYNLSSLRYITNSGGKIPVEYVERMIRVFKKTKIYLMYGLTEAFRSTYLQPELIAQKPDSIGKAIPRVKISVLNNKGKECGPGEEGELVHRGALISLGYWNNKEATDKRIRRLPAGAKNAEIKEKGVFSGDIVKRDKEGFLYFVGRNDEMIKSSGYRISPTEIEEVLYRIKGINAVVVFGVEDLMLGQKIKAVIYQEAQKNTRIGILEYCKKNLPDYSVPHEIIFADKMPKTSSGKLDRSLIKSMVLSDKA